MATVDWDVFYPYVQPHLPGCPEIVIDAHLQEAAAEFLERSEIWRFDIDLDITARNEPDYQIDVPTGAVLHDVIYVALDGHELRKVSDKHMNSSVINGTAKPQFYSMYQNDSIRLFPTPDASYKFKGVGILKTSLTAKKLEEFIWENHGRCIAYGAISRLAMIPGKEWSNPDAGVYYRNMFISEADAAKAKDYRRVNVRVATVGFDGVARKGIYRG
jgi:hypothetical protein